jgi:hypothetical protein
MLTLTTDFGLQDVYVGVMKGVIANINPELNVIDLTHQIPPQNIAAGRFCLMNAIPYFPQNTVHVAVVDPGVGSSRKGCAIALSQGFLVGPDNGLFSGVLRQFPAQKVVTLTNSNYWRTETVSRTFHGRDIFAPVGAYLASGVPLEELGEPMTVKELNDYSFPTPEIRDHEIIGYIQYIDYFGNLITNIPGVEVNGKQWFVTVTDQTIASGMTYSSCPPQNLIALIGSHGWVEIAMNQGSAARALSLSYGDPVKVIY